MGTLTEPEARASLLRVTENLQYWHTMQDSDSVRVQDFRAGEFAIAASQLELVTAGVQPDHRLSLHVGEQALDGVVLRKDSNLRMRRTIPAGTDFPLVRAVYCSPEIGAGIGPGQELYLGRVVMIGLHDIARTLTQGGRFDLIPAEVPHLPTAA